MADDSPGKVQALRAIFAEKNKPVMGMMPPGGKLINRPWKTFDSIEDAALTLKEKFISDQRVSSQLITKVLPLAVKRSELTSPEPKLNDELHKTVNVSNENINKVSRPTIGPKPSYLSQQNRTSSPVSISPLESSDSIQNDHSTTLDDGSNLAKSKTVADAIASFMFTNRFSHTISDKNNKNCLTPPLPVPRNLHQMRSNQINFCNLRTSNDSSILGYNVINSDNYICKSSFRRRELPPVEQLGSPPPKPEKPQHMVLPSKYLNSPCTGTTAQNSKSSFTSPHAVPSRPAPQRPAHPCPPRPHTPPPLPPPSVPTPTKPHLSLREEIEELYEDTLLGEGRQRPVSLIPEFTEEEEAEELYNDAGPVDDLPIHPVVSTLPMKPKDPPPPCPSEYLQPNVHITNEELYQDADDLGEDEEFYEEMPCDTLAEYEPGSPLYSNNKKEIERLKREEEKKARKEQKEREKREKEMEKIKRKFGLTGEEIPIDDGLVKADSRGGRGGDLPVRKGETVLILRMEGNPSGRWLVKNEKGKIGYVELTNIEVDPLSVKSAKNGEMCETPIEKNVNWLSKITACVRQVRNGLVLLVQLICNARLFQGDVALAGLALVFIGMNNYY